MAAYVIVVRDRRRRRPASLQIGSAIVAARDVRLLVPLPLRVSLPLSLSRAPRFLPAEISEGDALIARLCLRARARARVRARRIISRAHARGKTRGQSDMKRNSGRFPHDADNGWCQLAALIGNPNPRVLESEREHLLRALLREAR